MRFVNVRDHQLASIGVIVVDTIILQSIALYTGFIVGVRGFSTLSDYYQLLPFNSTLNTNKYYFSINKIITLFPWNSIQLKLYLHELWNPEVQCRIHKGSLIIPTISQINPIPGIDTYLHKGHPNCIFPVGLPDTILKAVLPSCILVT